MSKTEALLVLTFYNPKYGISTTVDSDNGKDSQWRFLRDEGFVTFTYKSGRGVMGHTFAGSLTAKGEALVESLVYEPDTIETTP